MSSSPTVVPVPPDRGSRRHGLLYLAVALGTTALSLLLLQLLMGRRLAEQQLQQLSTQVTANVVLAEVALERFSPPVLAQLSGLRLAVGPAPEATWLATRANAPDRRLGPQARWLRTELCRHLPRCPAVWPSRIGPRGVWVELGSSLETVWLFAPLPSLRGWPPDPRLLSLALVVGGLMTGLLYLAVEVQRPLRQLEQALGAVGLEERPAAVPARGAAAVRQLTQHFNAMLARLERASRERSTMLAGIAHDLRAPLTRLRLRQDWVGAEADLGALERITRQFLLFAGAEQEAPLPVPLAQLVAEAAAVVGETALTMELEPMQRCVRPIAISRAVTNLLENAMAHGVPPLALVLRARGRDGFEIQVWDRGAGIAAEQWAGALTPFQRLDPARGGQEGHCGLGLAIAERIARDHGGGLVRLTEAASSVTPLVVAAGPGFGVGLRGRSLPSL
ncbi:MAG: ATP-binding protein [Synechococcaceae cyanobacterium ELA739]